MRPVQVRARSPADSRNGSRRTSPAPERNTNELKNAQIVTKSGQTRVVDPEITLAEFYKHKADTKSMINLVVVGHVDAGKSTLMGHLLYRLGCVPKKMVNSLQVYFVITIADII